MATGTGGPSRAGGRGGPDVDVALLADLDAGLLDAHRADRVRSTALADPRAAAVLDGLAATRAELAALGPAPVPAAMAQRWSAALAAAAPAPAPPIRPRPARRLGVRARPALLAATLLAAVVAAVLPTAAPRSPDPSHRPPVVGTEALPCVSTTSGLCGVPPVELAAAGRAALGATDVGGLGERERRVGCLRAVAPPGVTPDALLIAGRRVELDGRPGVLLVLATGPPGTLHAVIVDPGCGPDGGTLLGATLLTR